MDWTSHKTDWPNAQHSQILRFGPHHWHLQVAGPAGSPVVLLLHGAGASAHSWTVLFNALSARFRVVALDLPGHGFTRRGGLGRAKLPRVAEDIEALLRDQKLLPDVIIGHSAGGAVALQMALTMPPKGVICLNGALAEFGGIAGWLFPALAKLLALNPITAPFFARTATPRNVEQMIKATGSDLTKEGYRPYYKLVRDTGHVQGTLAMMAGWDLRPLIAALPKIKTPVLLLAGGKDKAVDPITADKAAALLPNAQIKRLPGLGHLMHETHPDQILAEMIPFVEACLAASPLAQPLSKRA